MSSLNVLGTPLKTCCLHPQTGFYRDGMCRTDEHDRGKHVICATMTLEFLEFSRAQGNDLITPRPQWSFPGLKPGDCWCLCADRWREALDADVAPPVNLDATHQAALDHVTLEDLLAHARIDGECC